MRTPSRRPRKTVRFAAWVACLGILLSLQTSAERAHAGLQSPAHEDILHYISSSWSVLTRSASDCQTFVDPKTHAQSFLYLPAGFEAPAEIEAIEKRCSLRVLALPKPITRIGELDIQEIHPEGLLYLPHPYVVPGGMFNEMYGWDSYFIIRGLVEDGKLDLAQGMVEDFFFELDHYGGIHNANRGYFLTRSQPPFLTSMVLAVYDAKKKQGHEDHAWLEKAYADRSGMMPWLRVEPKWQGLYSDQRFADLLQRMHLAPIS